MTRAQTSHDHVIVEGCVFYPYMRVTSHSHTMTTHNIEPAAATAPIQGLDVDHDTSTNTTGGMHSTPIPIPAPAPAQAVGKSVLL